MSLWRELLTSNTYYIIHMLSILTLHFIPEAFLVNNIHKQNKKVTVSSAAAHWSFHREQDCTGRGPLQTECKGQSPFWTPQRGISRRQQGMESRATWTCLSSVTGKGGSWLPSRSCSPFLSPQKVTQDLSDGEKETYPCRQCKIQTHTDWEHFFKTKT